MIVLVFASEMSQRLVLYPGHRRWQPPVTLELLCSDNVHQERDSDVFFVLDCGGLLFAKLRGINKPNQLARSCEGATNKAATVAIHAATVNPAPASFAIVEYNTPKKPLPIAI